MCSGLPRLGDARHTHEDLGDLIPGGIVHDSCRCEAKDALEGTDSIGSGCSKDTVFDDARYGGIILGDPVELLLHLQDFLPGGADRQVIARP